MSRRLEDPAANERRRRPAIVWLSFAALGLLALALRAWGLAFARGLPRGRPDEELYLIPALRMFGESLNPGLLWYGFTEGFHLILHAALRLAAVLLAWRHGTEVNLGCLFVVNPTAVLLIGRWISVALGTLTLVPAALIARRLVAPPLALPAALVATLLLAVNYLHGRDSHFAVPDAALTFVLAWALWAAARANEDGRARHALLAGLFTGLAAAIKWTGLFMLPVLALVLLAMIWRARRVHPWRALLLGVAALTVAVGAFLALDPHVPGELQETYKGLLGHSVRYGEQARAHLQDRSRELELGIRHHSLVTLPIACGWLTLAAALLGLAVALARRPRVAWPCLLFLAALYGAAVGPTRLLFVRYCLPVIPAIAALAAAGLTEGAGSLGRLGLRPVARGALLTAFAVAAAAPPALRLIQADRLLARPDTRELAARWLLEHAPDGATVVPEIAYSCLYAVRAEGVARCNAALPSELRGRVVRLPGDGVDWAGALEGGRAGWATLADNALNNYWNSPGLALAPDYVTQGTPLLACGKPADIRGLEPLDPACFEEVARFSPGRASCDAVYDLFDQFYVPYAGFDGIERPGPEIAVYRNRCARAHPAR